MLLLSIEPPLRHRVQHQQWIDSGACALLAMHPKWAFGQLWRRAYSVGMSSTGDEGNNFGLVHWTVCCACNGEIVACHEEVTPFRFPCRDAVHLALVVFRTVGVTGLRPLGRATWAYFLFRIMGEIFYASIFSIASNSLENNVHLIVPLSAWRQSLLQITWRHTMDTLVGERWLCSSKGVYYLNQGRYQEGFCKGHSRTMKGLDTDGSKGRRLTNVENGSKVETLKAQSVNNKWVQKKNEACFLMSLTSR